MKQITTFWNWFLDNEKEIKYAFLLGINTTEVFFHLQRNLDYVSKRIGFMIIGNSETSGKCAIIFTAYGYRKLFPKIIALEDQAPHLQYFTPQAFIKPIQNLIPYRERTDSPCRYENYEIRISQLQMALTYYNTKTKQLKMKIFMPDYDTIKQFDDLNSELRFIAMEIVGEIAYRKHIQKIEFAQLPRTPKEFSSLIELPEIIDTLYKINSREKTRTI